jgi:hypothetical protein
VGDLKENDGMITCSITKKQLILLQTTLWYVIPADDKEMCVILWVKSFGKKCRNTDIQTPEMDEKEKNRIVQRDAGKE